MVVPWGAFFVVKRANPADLSTVAPAPFVNNPIHFGRRSGTPGKLSDFKSESLSDLPRIRCPIWIGISVRNELESLSELPRSTHRFECLPAHAISTKIKHLLVIYSIPTRGFTAVVSVFTGTPPAKPFDCKSRPNSRDVLDCDRRADPTGGEPRLSHVPIRVGVSDIS